jgi:type III secretory pathway component EscT
MEAGAIHQELFESLNGISSSPTGIILVATYCTVVVVLYSYILVVVVVVGVR